MESAVFGFEQLEIWKIARQFKIEVQILTLSFPPEEKYRLKDQLIRSSRSVNSLLAEGHGRYTFQEQIHYCIQARGSLTESVNHLIDAFDEKLINEEQLFEFKKRAKRIERMINRYIVYLRQRKTEERK
jgi:four helix bundle protein